MTTVRLEIRDFPRPAVARSLSPNASGSQGFWVKKRLARISVQTRVAVEAHVQGLPKMRNGVVTVRPEFVYPVQRRRDIDNACTGVLKACLDALVKGGWLVDDSVEYVRLEAPLVRVEPGKRGLVLEFETSEVRREVVARQPIGRGNADVST